MANQESESSPSAGWGVLVLGMIAGGIWVSRRIGKEDLKVEAALWKERTQRRQVYRRQFAQERVQREVNEAESRLAQARAKLAKLEQQPRKEALKKRIAEKFPYWAPEAVDAMAEQPEDYVEKRLNP